MAHETMFPPGGAETQRDVGDLVEHLVDKPLPLVAVEQRVFGVAEVFDHQADLAPEHGFHDPALVLFGLVRVLHQGEVQLVTEKVNGFVVVPHDQGDVNDGLMHASLCGPGGGEGISRAA